MSAVIACTQCGREKPRTPEHFHRKGDNADGFSRVCIPCRAAAAKARKARNPEAHAARNRENQKRYRERHREKVLSAQREYNARYYARKPEAIQRARAKYKERHPDRYRQSIARWQASNRERVRTTARLWAQANPDKVTEKARRWRQNNLASDAAKARRWRAMNTDKVSAARKRRYGAMKQEAGGAWIRMRVANVVKQHVRLRLAGGKQRRSWSALVGYSIDDFIRHIERQFRGDMSWLTWGRAWHLDHILPVASFNVREVGDAEFMACWSLANLRPLPARENLSKGAKRVVLL